MPTIISQNVRTIATVAVVAGLLIFSYTNLRLDAHTALMPFFEWMERTWFGVIGKTWGGAFAFIEAVHLLGLALLGGSVLVGNGRLLGILFADVPARIVIDRSFKLFNWALIILLATGVFIGCGVAMKIYYLKVFWYKMLALGVGMLFEYFIRMPLLKKDLDAINPWILKGVAISSVMIWFTVGATGRWIGYSG